MKLNITVDVQELIEDIFELEAENYAHDEYFSQDFDIKESIKDDITRKVKKEVLKVLKDPLHKDINEKVKVMIRDSYSKEVEKSVSDFIANGKVTKTSYSKEEVSVKEWIKNNFYNNFDTRGKLESIVKKECENLANEIRDRYDLLFASSLVSKLQDQGLLKDGVFKALMKGEK